MAPRLSDQNFKFFKFSKEPWIQRKNILKENKCLNMTFRRYRVTPLSNVDLSRSVHIYTSLGVKKESAKRSSDKWTKTFYRDYLHCIGNIRIIFFYAFILILV